MHRGRAAPTLTPALNRTPAPTPTPTLTSKPDPNPYPTPTPTPKQVGRRLGFYYELVATLLLPALSFGVIMLLALVLYGCELALTLTRILTLTLTIALALALALALTLALP